MLWAGVCGGKSNIEMHRRSPLKMYISKIGIKK